MTPEHLLMNQIRAWCGEHDILCFRSNVGRVLKADNTWFDTGLPSGFPDLIAFDKNSHTIFIECKVKYNKQSDDQVKFMQEMRSRGFIYILAYNLQDVEKTIQNCLFV